MLRAYDSDNRVRILKLEDAKLTSTYNFSFVDPSEEDITWAEITFETNKWGKFIIYNEILDN